MKNAGREPNSLIHETSPYLLQHAYNPVQWYAWGPAAWEKARAENKLVIISVGYSACHWCHVMEHESFEDPDVAAVMNEHYVSIKVDREERPDIDSVYMEAVQIMTGRGGWPLNCIVLPDGRPVYGGTYFPREGWVNVLQNIHDIYTNDKAKVLDYAENMMKGLHEAELVKTNPKAPTQEFDLQNVAKAYIGSFDTVYGGPRKAPKFPMPANYTFLLDYGVLHHDETVLDHVHLTLTKMAYGGIYDQLGGGFARYSVDELWKVPHFEKMLYDNAQLVSLYAKAWAQYRDPLFKHTVLHTLAFMDSELLSPDGLYYAALDADSEGVEGKFYVWTLAELSALLTPKQLEAVKAYYSINDYGYWEHDNYVLIRRYDEAAVAATLGITVDALMQTITEADKILLAARSQRVRPGLDDKCLLSWNALALKGICEAGIYLHDESLVKRAEALYATMQRTFTSEGQWLRSYKNGKAVIPAFSEDLALLAEAVLALYEATFNTRYLEEADALVEMLIRDFYEPETGMFYYTPKDGDALIVRKTEIFDNVISSSNSVMAGVLHKLGMLAGNEAYMAMREKMLNRAAVYFENAPQALANWLDVWLMANVQQKEVVCIGPRYKEAVNKTREQYMPLVVWCAAENENGLPLLASRLISGQTGIYECRFKACNLPVIF